MHIATVTPRMRMKLIWHERTSTQTRCVHQVSSGDSQMELVTFMTAAEPPVYLGSSRSAVQSTRPEVPPYPTVQVHWSLSARVCLRVLKDAQRHIWSYPTYTITSDTMTYGEIIYSQCTNKCILNTIPISNNFLPLHQKANAIKSDFELNSNLKYCPNICLPPFLGGDYFKYLFCQFKLYMYTYYKMWLTVQMQPECNKETKRKL